MIITTVTMGKRVVPTKRDLIATFIIRIRVSAGISTGRALAIMDLLTLMIDLICSRLL